MRKITDEEFEELKAKAYRATNQIIYAYGAYDEHDINRRLRGLNEGYDPQEHGEIYE